ncbi:hypothetical protein HELRODRAFT_85388, partial [Helobdella robusta]|uniref:HD/PDEase domain-containing protein n=1 Tax=Helobdella robusta TaxID=6412 RepID=T1G5W3_HELRO
IQVMNDPIHGHIEISPLCMAIVDTPQFQRLRFIKMTGTGSLVYPGAVHTRFEHSIGVCHLAETLCRTMQQKQPELNITESDVSCVAVAGLCHDLGHGPFSHLYDQLFIPSFRRSAKLPDWKHEQASVDMLDYIIKENNLKHLFSDEDLMFIKEQIMSPTNKVVIFFLSNLFFNDLIDYQGRGQDKMFLYEIVANNRTGIDVDRWDYFLRDSHYLGLKVSFDPGRLLKFVRVIDVNGEKQICARNKEADNLYEMYHCRSSLFKQAYLHKTTIILNYMICEAMKLADDHLFFPGTNGKLYKMSEGMNDMEAFWKMTDDIILQILHSSRPELSRSREWIKRVFSRNLPKIVGLVKESDNPKLKWSADWIHEQLVMDSTLLKMNLTADDFIVVKRSFNYGMKEKNPLENCMFYSKHNPDVAYKVTKDQVSPFLPEKFLEVQYLVYCSEDEKQSVANEVYMAFCLRHNILIYKVIIVFIFILLLMSIISNIIVSFMFFVKASKTLLQ